MQGGLPYPQDVRNMKISDLEETWGVRGGCLCMRNQHEVMNLRMGHMNGDGSRLEVASASGDFPVAAA